MEIGEVLSPADYKVLEVFVAKRISLLTMGIRIDVENALASAQKILDLERKAGLIESVQNFLGKGDRIEGSIGGGFGCYIYRPKNIDVPRSPMSSEIDVAGSIMVVRQSYGGQDEGFRIMILADGRMKGTRGDGDPLKSNLQENELMDELETIVFSFHSLQLTTRHAAEAAAREAKKKKRKG